MRRSMSAGFLLARGCFEVCDCCATGAVGASPADNGSVPIAASGAGAVGDAKPRRDGTVTALCLCAVCCRAVVDEDDENDEDDAASWALLEKFLLLAIFAYPAPPGEHVHTPGRPQRAVVPGRRSISRRHGCMESGDCEVVAVVVNEADEIDLLMLWFKAYYARNSGVIDTAKAEEGASKAVIRGQVRVAGVDPVHGKSDWWSVKILQSSNPQNLEFRYLLSRFRQR